MIIQMKKITVALLLLVATMMLFACSGGGGGGTSSPPGQSSTATIKISTQGTYPSGALIGGINVTLTLPTGVIVKSKPDTYATSVLVTDIGGVVSSGVASANSSVLATFSPAAGNDAGTVNIQIANPSGFVIGEFVTVNSDIAFGSNPVAGDFSLSKFVAVDLNGAVLSTLSATLAATIK
ncbi:MAG: hypothetical protein ACOY9D_11945 [Pseudomonadota bacterium]